jgi:hypothetical protein
VRHPPFTLATPVKQLDVTKWRPRATWYSTGSHIEKIRTLNNEGCGTHCSNLYDSARVTYFAVVT